MSLKAAAIVTALVVGSFAAGTAVRSRGSFAKRYNPHEDPDFDLQTEMAIGVLVRDVKSGDGYEAYCEGEHIAREKSKKMMLFRIGEWMKQRSYFPNIFYVNERGNVDLLDKRGRILASWV